jgi:predicted dehydrogenase
MLAEVSMNGPGLRVRLSFDGDSAHLKRDVTVVTGSEGSLVAEGPDLERQQLTLQTTGGSVEIPLTGDWFTTGFEGAMCELVCAVQEGREPSHGAANNLRSLELAFAACESANTGRVVQPGEVRSFPAPDERGSASG